MRAVACANDVGDAKKRTCTQSAYTVRFRTVVVGAFIATCEQSMRRSQQVLSYSRWAPLRVYELSARAASTTSCKWCANATWHTVACMNVSTCCCSRVWRCTFEWVAFLPPVCYRRKICLADTWLRGIPRACVCVPPCLCVVFVGASDFRLWRVTGTNLVPPSIGHDASCMGTLLHRLYEAVALVLHTCVPVCKDEILAWAASIGMAMMLDERYVPPASC